MTVKMSHQSSAPLYHDPTGFTPFYDSDIDSEGVGFPGKACAWRLRILGTVPCDTSSGGTNFRATSNRGSMYIVHGIRALSDCRK